MIQRVLGWVAALGALNPKHADFQKNGWNPVYRAGHALLGFFENSRTDQVAGFKTIRDKNGAPRLYRVVREDTEENRVAIVEGLSSAARVEKLILQLVSLSSTATSMGSPARALFTFASRSSV